MKQLYANNAKTVLQNSVSAADSSIVVVDGSAFPSPGANEFFLVTLEVGTQREILLCVQKTGNIFSVAGRAQEGTVASSFAAGATVECRVTRDTLSRLSKALYMTLGVETLVAPKDSFNDGYICSTYDPTGNPVMTVTKSPYTWRFLNYTIQATYAATAGTTTSVSATNLSLSSVTQGKYLVQFTSGALTGLVRAVDSIAAGTLNWTATTPSAPQVGDTFEIVKANSSILLDALSIGDDAIIMPLILGGN